MAIDIITGFNSSSQESLDKRSGPYATLDDAKAALDTNERYVGLKVLVADGATPDSAGNFIDGDLTEYVFTGGISDNDLVTAIQNLGLGGTDSPTFQSLSLSNKLSNEPSFLDLTDPNYANTGLTTRIVQDVNGNFKIIAGYGDSNNVILEVEPASSSVVLPGGFILSDNNFGIDTIEGTITDDDTHMPTSGAVVDYVDTLLDTKPSSADYDNIVKMTQSDYEALDPKISTTLYIVTP